ncbi:hypothetical protein DOM21_15040 [Bacteriovorax stolpii]|uniref:3-hydroxyacyl-ACP dehydratase FabZ family protein n=1 Tax=Bacteriovorax stolpii TaxID=960 RepID=UPI0011581540|nr:3-hydroxyacyl-ACP dehydratase FabZ family protein [Bacteriovorax stolpii]QDK42741.1 hypothetical protein DOM21_15040 [Bacteriovorax stolpii]
MSINIHKRLHHRAPYLMVDKVLEHSSEHIVAAKTPALEDFYIQGHFPGAHVVPGAMMQEMTTQTAGLLIAEHHSPVADYDSEATKGYALGVLRSVHNSKFKKFARPGEKLEIHVRLIEKNEQLFRFKGSITVGEDKIMSNEFTLINISDTHILDSLL